MKNSKNEIWGLVFILIGLIIGINALEIAEINIFFDGWWTLFIIIPSIIGLFNDKEKTGSIIGLLIGSALLLASQKIIDFDIIWKLMFPSILIIIGFSLMFKSSKFNREIEKVKKYKNEDDEYYATFSSQNINFDNEEFKGAEISAIFGGIKLDLRNATIKEDIIIDATAIFGGIEILAPKDIKIKVKSLPIFGGTSNKTINSKTENAHTIYINSTTIFGGLDIK